MCSLVSLVWQFGTLHLLGYGLDPLAVLVPFLVFAIGVSHGVQQVNYISQGICAGKSSFEAARASFTGLLIPGTMALVTAFVGFATLYLVPIPMIRELSITASMISVWVRFPLESYSMRATKLSRGSWGRKLQRFSESARGSI